MGSSNGANVSKYENFTAQPTLRTVLALEIIFDVPPRELFAGIFQAVEMVTYGRARELTARFEKAQEKSSVKLEAVRAIVERRSGLQAVGDHA